MIAIDLVLQGGEWEPLTDLQRLIEPPIHQAIIIADLSLPEHSEMAIVFADDAHVHRLNDQWRHQDKPTNVLSFASNNDGDLKIPLLGDIVLARETILREANDQGKSFQDHLVHLCVHGFLHLVGYDHVEEADAVEMERLETDILAACGISDPYTFIAG